MLSLLFALALAATPLTPRSIVVAGDARLAFRPNQVVATFLISSSHRDQAAARKGNDEKLGKLLRACRDAGVEQRNLMVYEGAVNPEYRGNEVVSFAVNRSLVMTITDMARVDDALTAAVRNGGVQASVVLQNTELFAFETKARVAAATSARERARGIAEALGAKLGLPVSVSDQTGPVQGSSTGSFHVPADGPVITSYGTRELTVTSQVHVNFDLEPLQ